MTFHQYLPCVPALVGYSADSAVQFVHLVQVIKDVGCRPS